MREEEISLGGYCVLIYPESPVDSILGNCRTIELISRPPGKNDQIFTHPFFRSPNEGGAILGADASVGPECLRRCEGPVRIESADVDNSP